MACPTCSHTMEGLGCGYYWCPRCGTLKEQQGLERFQLPKLVSRVRSYMAEVGAGGQDGLFHQLGITEATYPPGER